MHTNQTGMLWITGKILFSVIVILRFQYIKWIPDTRCGHLLNWTSHMNKCACYMMIILWSVRKVIVNTVKFAQSSIETFYGWKLFTPIFILLFHLWFTLARMCFELSNCAMHWPMTLNDDLPIKLVETCLEA